jgi:hypothetical protein
VKCCLESAATISFEIWKGVDCGQRRLYVTRSTRVGGTILVLVENIFAVGMFSWPNVRFYTRV